MGAFVEVEHAVDAIVHERPVCVFHYTVAVQVAHTNVALVGNPVLVHISCGAVGDVGLVGGRILIAIRFTRIGRGVFVAVIDDTVQRLIKDCFWNLADNFDWVFASKA